MAVVWRLGAGYTAGVDYVTNSAASGTSLAINKPSGLVDGQTLRAYFYSQASAGAATTTPSGWTLEVAPTSRRGGIYRKYIPSAAAETATSYTFSQGGSGRMVGVIWLSEGEPTSSNTDAVGSFVTETTAPSAASLTATESDDLLATFHYWNNSSTTVTASNFPGSMTELIEVNSPTTGNTSGIGIAIEQLSTSGATGTRQVTGTPTPVNASAVSILYKAAPTAPTRTATGGVTLGGTADGQQAGDVRTATGGVTLGGTATGAEVIQYVPVDFDVPTMDAWIAKGYPVHWAHRGGSANWSEMTMYAYDNAVRVGARCLEVSVHRSSDGVWIMSHDATLTRVTGNSITISSTNSSSMIGMAVTAPGSGGVIGRLEDVLDEYGDNKVILVDNKPGSFFSDFLDLLETYPNAHDQFIVKLDGQFGSLANFQAAQARGFKTCGYWYPNNYAAHLPGKAPYTDYIGMQYDATSGEWADVHSYGKPVWGHVIQNQTQYDLCTAGNVDIYQLANVEDLMPGWNEAWATDGAALSGTAQVTGVSRTATGGVTLGGSVTASERYTRTATGGVTLGGAVTTLERQTRTATAGVTVSGTATGIGTMRGSFGASMTLGPAEAVGDRSSDGGFVGATSWGAATMGGSSGSGGTFGGATVAGPAEFAGSNDPEGAFGAAVTLGPAAFGAESPNAGVFGASTTWGPAGYVGDRSSDGAFGGAMTLGPAEAVGESPNSGDFGAASLWGPANAGSFSGATGGFSVGMTLGPAAFVGRRVGEGVFTTAIQYGPALASAIADRAGGFGASIEYGSGFVGSRVCKGDFAATGYILGPARFSGPGEIDFAALAPLGLTLTMPKYELTMTKQNG